LGNPKKVIFNGIHTYFRLFTFSEKNKLLPPYPPHLKNVTALPCKNVKLLHLTAGIVAFLQMLATLKRAGCVLALVALKMTDQRDKKLTIEQGYADNRK